MRGVVWICWFIGLLVPRLVRVFVGALDCACACVDVSVWFVSLLVCVGV